MNKKAKVLNFKPSEATEDTQKQVRLHSGRRIIAETTGKDDLVEIIEPGGAISVSIRLTAEGPVFSVHGARLELKSADTITLEAKKIRVTSEEETVVKSNGNLEVGAAKEMKIHSKDDIRVNGKMIHLN